MGFPTDKLKSCQSLRNQVLNSQNYLNPYEATFDFNRLRKIYTKSLDLFILRKVNRSVSNSFEHPEAKFIFICTAIYTVALHLHDFLSIDESLCPFDIVTKYFEAIDNGKEVGK